MDSLLLVRLENGKVRFHQVGDLEIVFLVVSFPEFFLGGRWGLFFLFVAFEPFFCIRWMSRILK